MNLTANQLPLSFKPLLWSLRWEHVDPERDKADIIRAAVNEGTLDQWRWIVGRYGKTTIRAILADRLTTEFHPESLRLAELLFDLPSLRHAR